MGSMELLLSLVEFIQFKKAIRAQQQIVGGVDDFANIELPDCVPKSSIVHNEAHDLKTKARKLFEKYVEIGCEYEINISYGLRCALSERLAKQNIGKDHNVEGLGCIFD